MTLLRRSGVGDALLALLVAALVLGLLSLLANYPNVRALETNSLDLRFQIRGPIPPGPDVAIIKVDDQTLAEMGRWPLSRRIYADAITRLDRAGAKVIVFDMLFPDAEQTVPPWVRDTAAKALAAIPANGDAALRARLATIATDDPDGEFERAIRASGKVLLPLAFSTAGPAKDPPYDLSDFGYVTFDRSPRKPGPTLNPVAAMVPIERLGTAAAGLAHINWYNDLDGVPRYDYVALSFEGDFIPSIPVRAAAAYLGVPWPAVGLALGQGVRIGKIMVPTDTSMRLLINYLGPNGTVPTWSFADFMAGKVPDKALQGRVVLIGGSFTGNSDSYPSPFGGLALPGTERLADTIDTIVNQRFIAENPPNWLEAGAAIILLLAGMAGALGANLPRTLSPLPGIATIGIWLVIAQIAFDKGIWLPVVGPVAALLAASVIALIYRYGIVEQEGRRVRSAFRHYMAPAMVDALAADPKRLRLGGETRCMSFLFCDIRGFTAISEKFKSDPQGLIQLINGFLTPMTDVILAQSGTIDKYIGDCIMAFWNAPLDDPRHADHACESALAMIAALENLNGTLSGPKTGDTGNLPPLKLGIGINTGDCVVGNMGSARRFDYSVLGDPVNLASRLEGQSKNYGVAIVIGEETRAQAPDWATLELDLIAVTGKREAVRIYTLLGDAALASSPAFLDLANHHAAMLSAYRARDWGSAQAAVARCRALRSDLKELYDLYQSRIDAYRANPPGESWNGVFVALSK